MTTHDKEEEQLLGGHNVKEIKKTCKFVIYLKLWFKFIFSIKRTSE